MDGNVTIKTIAQRTDLSLTTVSRVLNGTSEKYRISKKTQEFVIAEAKNLGYIPNMAAKTLRSNKSRNIGLVLPSLNNPFFSLVASTISQILFKKDYVVLMGDCNGDDKEEKKMLQGLISQNLQGIFVVPSGDKKNYEFLENSTVPTVFIDRYFEELDFYHVSTDHYGSSMQLMEHLIESGHKKIACIQGDKNVISNKLRVKAYLDSLSKTSLNYHYVGGASFTSEEGYLETKILLQNKDRPTAILALSDTILLGVLKALKENKLKIPEDVSVVSIDNSAYLDYLEVPITSVSQPVSQIAQLATKLLLDLIAQKNQKLKPSLNGSIFLESTIIFRSSVRKL